MIIAIWDWLFTRKQWTILHTISVYAGNGSEMPCERVYVMKDQFGNIKKKRMKY